MGVSLLERITVDPDIVHGPPAVRGTRLRVADVLSQLATGADEAEILEDHPYWFEPLIEHIVSMVQRGDELIELR